MPGRQEARRKTPKKRVKFLMKTAVFEHPVKRYTHCDFNPCRMVNAILLLDLSYVILISSY